MAVSNKRLRIILSNSNLPFSYGVRLVTWCHWSHAGIIMDDDRVIESTFMHHGVKIDTLNNFKSRAKDWMIIEIDVADREAILKAAVKQLDKPYDWTALFGILFRNRDWQEDDMWFCFELVAFACQEGGTPIVKPPRIHRVTGPDILAYPHRTIAVHYA